MRTTGIKQVLATVFGVLVPLLPKGACPLCLGAYGAVLSTLGLGFLAFVAACLVATVGPFLLAILARAHH